MLTYGIFGITNSALNLAVELVVLFLVVIWLALVYWTYADARRRIRACPDGSASATADRRSEDHAAACSAGPPRGPGAIRPLLRVRAR